MTPTPPSSPAPATWWQRACSWAVANRRPLAAGLGVVLMVACPFLPPAVQLPCRLARQGLQAVQQLDVPSSSAEPSKGLEPRAGCPEPPIRSLPHFCRCVGDGDWRDYWDLDAGCPED